MTTKSLITTVSFFKVRLKKNNNKEVELSGLFFLYMERKHCKP